MTQVGGTRISNNQQYFGSRTMDKMKCMTHLPSSRLCYLWLLKCPCRPTAGWDVNDKIASLQGVKAVPTVIINHDPLLDRTLWIPGDLLSLLPQVIKVLKLVSHPWLHLRSFVLSNKWYSLWYHLCITATLILADMGYLIPIRASSQMSLYPNKPCTGKLSEFYNSERGANKIHFAVITLQLMILVAVHSFSSLAQITVCTLSENPQFASNKVNHYKGPNQWDMNRLDTLSLGAWLKNQVVSNKYKGKTVWVSLLLRWDIDGRVWVKAHSLMFWRYIPLWLVIWFQSWPEWHSFHACDEFQVWKKVPRLQPS